MEKFPPEQVAFIRSLRVRRAGVIAGMCVLCVAVGAGVGLVLYWEAAELLSLFPSLGSAGRVLAVVGGFSPGLAGGLYVGGMLGGEAARRRKPRWVEELVARGGDRATLEAVAAAWE